MTITRYVTADGIGALSLVARAVDPNGNPITQKFTITANPLPESQKCYNAVIALGTVQGDIQSACAQFGVFSTYYIGNPRSTVYRTDSCSELIGDGFYKTEDGNWLNITNGRIDQRGSCVSTRVVPEIPPLPISLPGGQTAEVFVPKPAFTEPAPSLVPPQRDVVLQGGNTQRVKPTVVGARGQVKEVPARNSAELIKQAQSLGITVRADQASDILRGGGVRGAKQAIEVAQLRKKVEVELERREKAARATTTTQTFNQPQQVSDGVEVANIAEINLRQSE